MFLVALITVPTLIRGVNHAWSNRSDKPCLIYGFMTHANLWPADKYPAEGL